MLVHSLASKYARFVVIVRQMYWTPPPSDHWTPPLLKSDDLFFREPRDIGPPPFKNPGHAPVYIYPYICKTIIIVSYIHNVKDVISLYCRIFKICR